MDDVKIHNISITKLVKICRERAEKLPDNETDIPSTKALLIFAAEVIDSQILGDNNRDVIFPLTLIDRDDT